MFLGIDDKKGLKFILENTKILKLIHDCRSDWESLLYQYEVRLYNFIDTQEVFFLYKLFFFEEVVRPTSYQKFLLEITNNELAFKDKVKDVMTENPEIWGERPLEEELLCYAAQDVEFLIKAWEVLMSILNENLMEISYFISILKVVNKTLFDQFKEFLITNVMYLTSTLQTKSQMKDYDYVYRFLQLKAISSQHVKSIDTDEMNSFRKIIEYGICYKYQQRKYFKFISTINKARSPDKRKQIILKKEFNTPKKVAEDRENSRDKKESSCTDSSEETVTE